MKGLNLEALAMLDVMFVLLGAAILAALAAYALALDRL